jgi:hypothetical protein
MNQLDSNYEPGKKPVSSIGAAGSDASVLPPYEPPILTVMNEDEVLSAFQVPVVASSWWG